MNGKHFYKLDEYTGKLPNPKMFSTEGVSIAAIKGRPNTFSDGYIADLAVDKSNRKRLKGKVGRTVSEDIFRNVLEEAKQATILLSEPQYIYDGSHLAYVLTAPDIKPVGIQIKYYQYFRNRYPKCKFYTDDRLLGVKAIRVGRKLVGLYMPIMLPQVEE